MPPPSHVSCTLIAAAAAAVLIAAPLAGWPSVVRLPAVLVPALLLGVIVLRPWRWRDADWQALEEWTPSRRVILTGAAGIALLLFWLVLTRFRAGEINAVDFTVYFDRPCFQTVQGRMLFVETADLRDFSHLGELGHHAYWGLIPLCYLYALRATPFWLLALPAVAVTVGAVYVLRVMRSLGAPGVLATATALAFALNDNTARTLNYGFHPEVLYAWFIPWMLDAGIRRDRHQFLAAVVAAILVKEDAMLPLFAASVALGLIQFRHMTGVERFVFLVLPVSLALANLGLYYRMVLPTLITGGLPVYATFWASYGSTPIDALAGMFSQPLRILADGLRSGFFRFVMLPHLFLPAIGWRWVLGIVPTVLIFSASDDPQLRLFGVYYSISLVPFLVIGASMGAMMLARRCFADVGRAGIVAASVILLGAMVVGSGNRGYSLRPWRAEVAAVPAALSLLADERAVLVQSGLYPHGGYEERVQLLTPDTLQDPRNADAAILMAETIGAFPLGARDLSSLRQLVPIRTMPGGLLAVRNAVKPEVDRPPHRLHGPKKRHSRPD